MLYTEHYSVVRCCHLAFSPFFFWHHNHFDFCTYHSQDRPNASWITFKIVILTSKATWLVLASGYCQSLTTDIPATVALLKTQTKLLPCILWNCAVIPRLLIHKPLYSTSSHKYMPLRRPIITNASTHLKTKCILRLIIMKLLFFFSPLFCCSFPWMHVDNLQISKVVPDILLHNQLIKHIYY